MSKECCFPIEVHEFVEAYEAALPEDKRHDVNKRWLEAVQKYGIKLNRLGQIAEIALEIEPTSEALGQHGGVGEEDQEGA